MPQKKHKLWEIVAKLLQVDVLLSQGQSVAEAVRPIRVTQFIYNRWRKEYGGLKTNQVKRHKELEKENERLRRAVAEAKIVIESWRRHYNTKRPHSALGYRPPAPDVIQWRLRHPEQLRRPRLRSTKTRHALKPDHSIGVGQVAPRRQPACTGNEITLHRSRATELLGFPTSKGAQHEETSLAFTSFAVQQH